MDKELATFRLMLKTAHQALQARSARIDAERPRLSRHYSCIKHTNTMLILIAELRNIAEHDPDLWDRPEEEVPF